MRKIIYEVIMLSFFAIILTGCGGGDNGGGTPPTPTPTPLTDTAVEFTVDSNTIALWHLNETTLPPPGQVAFDSAYSNLLSYGIGTQAEDRDPSPVSDGRFGYCLCFNGGQFASREEILGGTIIPKWSNQFTIELWVKTTATPVSPDGRTNLFWANSATVDGWIGSYAIEIRTNGALGFAIDVTKNGAGGGTYYNNCSDTQSILDGNWHYVAAVFDGTVSPGIMSLYVDGLLKKTLTAPSINGYLGSVYDYYAGSSGTQYHFFNGKIDEIRLSNIARSAEAIASYYHPH